MSDLYGTSAATAPDSGTIAAATRETGLRQEPADSSGGYPDAAHDGGSGVYSDADIEAVLAAEDRLPEPRTRQDAAADTWGESADGIADSETAIAHDDDVEAQLTREEHLPEPRTRQDAAADTWDDSANGPAGSDPTIGDDGDVEAQLTREEHLPEPRTRQETAADTWGDPDSGSRPGHPDIRDRYPSDYKLAPDAQLPRTDGPHESPEKWLDAINPGKDVPGRRVNCGDCSRSVDSTWHGFPAVAAAVDYPRFLGDDPARMTEWAGTKPRPASMADIGKQLGELGPGSSAIVGCDWKAGRGHWFNAVNDSGTVKAVDGQSGKVEAWPPTRAGLGYDESRMRYSDAIFFIPDGKVVPH